LAAGSGGRIRKSAARIIAHAMATISCVMIVLPFYAAVLSWVPESTRWKAVASKTVLWAGVAVAIAIWLATYRHLKAMMISTDRGSHSTEA
jgi:hypothetical protein